MDTALPKGSSQMCSMSPESFQLFIQLVVRTNRRNGSLAALFKLQLAVAMPSGLHPRVLVVGYFNRVGLLAVVL